MIKEVSKKVMGWRCTNNAENEEFDIFWSDLGVLSDKLTKLKNYQKINHFPAMYNITRKNYLAKNLKRLERVFPNDYKFFPQTWLLPTDYPELRNQFHKKKVFHMICKPEASSQGKGIFITKKLEDLHPTAHCVVQRYLRNPYLIDGCKFDLRIYVLVTSCDPLKVFLYNEGLGRFATENYE